MNGFKLITDDQGLRTLVDAGGVRYFTEEQPGLWVAGVDAGSWDAWRSIAVLIAATDLANSGGETDG
jgi:hypothetical protein